MRSRDKNGLLEETVAMLQSLQCGLLSEINCLTTTKVRHCTSSSLVYQVHTERKMNSACCNSTLFILVTQCLLGIR